jgi:hypothetical protein
MLRRATTIEAVIAEHLRFQVADHVQGRHLFGRLTRREVLNYLGLPALVREFGHGSDGIPLAHHCAAKNFKLRHYH